MLSRSASDFVICMISPETRSSMTWLSSWMTSLLRRAARDTEARASRKSPARMATLLPKVILSAFRPRRMLAESMTSSCSRLATWISSVISAMRCCRRRWSVTWMAGGRMSTASMSGRGRPAARDDAISSRMVGLNRFPSDPNLKKYSAAVLRMGMSVRIVRRSLSDTLFNSSATSPKGSTRGFTARPRNDCCGCDELVNTRHGAVSAGWHTRCNSEAVGDDRASEAHGSS
mmetsp:Transcript_16159/g.48419  ORF Transcript_16159/g.48419 Transcript_16159/m.48419 type:complete len:231 (+) Transcript_16159:5419-6111(+)